MKRMKKLMAFLLTMVMVLAIAVPAMAAAGTPQSNGSISITSPDDVAATTKNTYTIYKIFDATVASNGNVAYKLLEGYADTNAPTGFTAKNGYITKAPESLNDTASALAEYVKKNSIAAAATVEITGPSKTVASKALSAGYYYVTTTTGSAVIVNANQETAIKDKNELSSVDKVAGTAYDASSKNAIAAVGTSQPFTVQITKKHGTGHIVFEDTMTNMTYNEDVTVTVNSSTVAAGATTYSVSTKDGKAGLTITFVDSYIKNLADNTIITLNYTATITSDALQENPAINKASLKLDNNNTTTTEDVKVYNASLTVTKVDGQNQALEGAGFKLKNSTGYYYKYTAATGTSSAKVEFVADEKEATEVMADTGEKKNVAVFAGIPAGTYTLIESTVPAGYNKADDTQITISDGDYTKANLALNRTVVNNAGSVLPSTGGIGTTIFYVIGAICVLGAGVLLVTRRRMSSN